MTRLIDADALKNDLITFFPNKCLEGITTKTLFNQILTDIDNAQTVEPFEPDYVGVERLKARQRGYEEGYHNGMEMGKTLNPKIKQGEWINHRNDYGHNIADCSLCGKAMQWHDEDEDGIPRYCWYCGADMGGNKE